MDRHRLPPEPELPTDPHERRKITRGIIILGLLGLLGLLAKLIFG